MPVAVFTGHSETDPVICKCDAFVNSPSTRPRFLIWRSSNGLKPRARRGRSTQHGDMQTRRREYGRSRHMQLGRGCHLFGNYVLDVPFRAAVENLATGRRRVWSAEPPSV